MGMKKGILDFIFILVYVWNYFIRYSDDTFFSKLALILKTAVLEHTESSRRTSSIQADCGFLKFCYLYLVLLEYIFSIYIYLFWNGMNLFGRESCAGSL